ncbi:hypothetical protein [Clostridium botulinum]|nr:hypothetical protein [Clostridium botulinum]
MFEEFQKSLKGKGVTEITLVTTEDYRTEGLYKKRGLQSDNEMVVMGKEL